MAVEIRIPRLGWNMEEGVFVGWLKADGDPIREGDPLFTLEGEKSAQEVEATESGVLHVPETAPRAGQTVPVGALVGFVLAPGESPPSAVAVRAPTATVAEVAEAAEKPPRPARNGVKASPLARRIARELNIDWTTLRGSGSSGRVRKADVLAASRRDPAAVADRPSPASRSVPLTPTRRTIAARMVESRSTTAAVTLTTTVDATNLVNLREQFRASKPDEVPGFTDFLVKLSALVLKDHAVMNSRWLGDRIELLDEVNVGIAVDAEAGLLVPVIRGADALGLREIVRRSRDLIGRARGGSLRAEEMQGGTFTITNLGAFGIETFTPIVNSPECAILGVGRIARQPVMVGESAVGRDRMPLSLTFDHRIVDGGPAARFLRAVGRAIENPGPWLMS